LTAHYDHWERRKRIFTGADDDGSGTVSIRNWPRHCEINKPVRSRRTIVFMIYREKGLWGSAYMKPVVPLNKTTANLNIDMIGRIDPNVRKMIQPIMFMGGDDKLSSDLRSINEAVNKIY
jgi:Zn-dependent M28 family amino/carboxypeptidase